MTKQDAKTTSSADDDVTFGDVEHQLPVAASAIDELVAVAAPAPADQAAIDDLQGADAAAGQEHETAVATAAALMDRVHEMPHVVPTGVSVNAEDDPEVKEPAFKVPRVDAVRPPVLNLPEVVTQHILTIIAHEDTLEVVNALPTALLPPAFQSLKALGGVVDLHGHWPCIDLSEIPNQHKRLALTALPAFPSIKFDVNLAWRTAERLAVTLRELIDALRLVPQLELTWIRGDDAASHATFSDVVNAWSDKVTAAEVSMIDLATANTTVRDALARCVNIQRARFSCAHRDDQTTLDACVESVMTPAHRLQSLKMHGQGAYNADRIVAWLQTPHAKALELSCLDVHCNGCLANAIATSPGLTSLNIKAFRNSSLLRALADCDLHRLTNVDIPLMPSTIGVLRQLDGSNLTSLSVGGGYDENPDAFGDVLAGFSALERLSLAGALPSNFGAGTCHHLVDFHGRINDETVMQQFAQWLGTARALKRLYLRSGLRVSFKALGSVLPQLMQRGLEYFEFYASTASEAIAELLAKALKCRRRHVRRLDIHLPTLSLGALKVLFSALTTCTKVTLHVTWHRNDNAAVHALVAKYYLRIMRRTGTIGVIESPV